MRRSFDVDGFIAPLPAYMFDVRSQFPRISAMILYVLSRPSTGVLLANSLPTPVKRLQILGDLLLVRRPGQDRDDDHEADRKRRQNQCGVVFVANYLGRSGVVFHRNVLTRVVRH